MIICMLMPWAPVTCKKLESLMADKSPFAYESAVAKGRGREVCPCNLRLDTYYDSDDVFYGTKGLFMHTMQFVSDENLSSVKQVMRTALGSKSNRQYLRCQSDYARCLRCLGINWLFPRRCISPLFVINYTISLFESIIFVYSIATCLFFFPPSHIL